MYIHQVNRTQENIKITNAIQATFADIRVTVTNDRITFKTSSHATIMSVRAAFNK